MPFSHEPSVVHWNGCDYWRTWFIDDCDSHSLFGINEKHLGLVTLRGVRVEDPRIRPYDMGTLIYLEDAPFFSTSKTHHCICGPYIVQAIKRENLNHDLVPEYETDNGVIIWFDPNARHGPWIDTPSIRRSIHNLNCRYSKIAREFNYFPYRFTIKKHQKYQSTLKSHSRTKCIFCS